jgi:hypothetical protein
MSGRDHISRGFTHLPPRFRRQVLHRLGRYAPWEPEFDFTPPPLRAGEVTGPPDFVGIGVQKAGTTWWYECMLSHPGISSPDGIHKERHFFDRFATQPFDEAAAARYHGWFPRRPGALSGEWTPDYFASPWTPPLLRRAAPDTRLLLILRDPVERFASGLAHVKRLGGPTGGSITADAVQRGFYHRALVEWLSHFDSDRLLVLQYERCAADPGPEMQATYRFLGLPEHRPQGLDRPAGSRSTTAPALAPEVKGRLAALYEADVLALANQLPGLDLSLWPNFSYLAGPSDPAGGSNSPLLRE